MIYSMIFTNVFKKFWLAMGVFVLFIQMNLYAYAEDGKWKDIQSRGVLNVGLSADYAPYEFEVNKDQHRDYAGIDIEIAKKIAQDHHLELKIHNMSFESLLGALKTGKIDMIISGMTPTPERKKVVDFSNPYMETKQSIVVRKADKSKFKSLADFDGHPIGAQKQTEQEKAAQTYMPKSNVHALSRLPEVLLGLSSGNVDAVIIEKPVAEAYLYQNDKLDFSSVELPEGVKDTAIALPKHAPELLKRVNASIKNIKDNDLIKTYKATAAEAMSSDESFIQRYGGFFVSGLKYTLLISVVGVVLGSILGGFVAWMKLHKWKVLRWPAMLYIAFLRGTPLLVQVFIVFFGTTAFLGFNISALICGIIAIVVNASAYIAEIMRAGINAVDKGQKEAALSLGLSHVQTMFYVILPQALKRILPALGNEFVTLIKESSIVSVIGVGELMFNTQVVQGASFDPFTPLLIAATGYFVLTLLLSTGMKYIERRWMLHD